jgi:hypothetical protein
MLGGLGDCTVALDTDRLPPAVLSDAREGCARLGVHTVEWRSGAGVPPDGSDALLSGLRWGERAVPGELLSAFEGTARRRPLLLACAEPLVEPSLTLHGGLVTIFQAPTSPGRVFSELRMALARRQGPRSEGGSPLVQEISGGGCWCAAVASPGGQTAPLLREDERGLFALVPLSPQGLQGGELLLATAVTALRSATAGKAGQLIASRLGEQAGLLGLLAAPRDWLIYWPSTRAQLWFCSPQRLPRLVDHTRKPEAPPAALQQLPAASGDLVVAFSRSVSAAVPVPAAGADGAPAWLERALPALGAEREPWSALVVEVRS